MAGIGFSSYLELIERPNVLVSEGTLSWLIEKIAI